jgi:hypothetical protein
MSAMMALTLYLELPRLALEMQRNREELLIERGEQYARAIKVFSKKNKKYPQTIEELENTNGIRFLRRRYLDPMTGKDEWRLIHMDGSGRLTDSLVQKQTTPGQTEQGKSTNTFVSEGASFGSTGPDPNANRVAQSLNRRASEQPGAVGGPPAPGDMSGNPGVPVDPLQQQQQQPYNPQQTMVPIMGPNGQPIQRVPGLPGQFGTGSPYPVQAANSQTGGAVSGGSSFGSGYSGSTGGAAVMGPQPGSPNVPGGFRPGGGSNSFGGSPFPGQGGPSIPGGPPSGINVNPATQMIQQILTRPNPQGMAALGGGLGTGGVAMGGGIAGVASKHDAEGIKIYKEKTNYKEWEFIYDPAKDQKTGQGGTVGGPIPGLGNMGTGSSTGSSGFGGGQQQPSTGFGGQQQGGFGQQRR